MRTAISKSFFRRALALATAFLFSSSFRVLVFAQSAEAVSSPSSSATVISDNGIILSVPVTEKVDDEDVKRIEILDEEEAEE